MARKTLALRLQSLLGPRGVAVLENLVLVLILVLVAELVVETVLERSSITGLSELQHRWFAWADLVICSVFLFEFALKLILAPDRISGFLATCARLLCLVAVWLSGTHH